MTEFWQDFELPEVPADLPRQARMIARMPDGSGLALPMRELGEIAVAGLISTQASFMVVDRIAEWMAAIAATVRPDVVAGLPTLGHVFASLVARRLGHSNWVALGTTRKIWYDEVLSVPLASITSPDAGRRLWLDPRMLPRLQGHRVLLVDDVISTGASGRAGLAVLAAAEAPPVAVCVAMAQANRWQAAWPSNIPLLAAFATPVFSRTPDGWVPVAGSAPLDCCPLMRR